jgi:hypothetical protein
MSEDRLALHHPQIAFLIERHLAERQLGLEPRLIFKAPDAIILIFDPKMLKDQTQRFYAPADVKVENARPCHSVL